MPPPSWGWLPPPCFLCASMIRTSALLLLQTGTHTHTQLILWELILCLSQFLCPQSPMQWLLMVVHRHILWTTEALSLYLPWGISTIINQNNKNNSNCSYYLLSTFHGPESDTDTSLSHLSFSSGKQKQWYLLHGDTIMVTWSNASESLSTEADKY